MVRFLCFVSMGALLAACQAPVNTVLISPSVEKGLEQVRVTLEFAGSETGATTVQFPVTWGPEESLPDLRSDLQITSSHQGTELDVTSVQGDLIIKHDPGARVKISYALSQDYPGEPAWGVQRVPGMRPVLQPEYGSLIGETFLPKLSNSQAWTFAFENLGDVSASFSQPLNLKAVSAPLSYEKIRGGLFTFGNFRYSEFKLPGLNLRTAIRGDWVISDEGVAEIAKAALGVTGDLFQDHPFNQYYIAMNQMPPIEGSSAALGTGLNESFFVLATPDADADTITHLITHELIHEWIARRMGKSDETTDPARMWFVEGFTEYFTQRVLLQSDMISSEEFVQNFDGLWQAYQKSSERMTPNVEMNNRLWDSPEMQRLPYQRGALLALHWDTVLRENGGALETVISEMIAASQEQDSGDETFNDAYVSNALEASLGTQFIDDYQTYLKNGEALNLKAFSLPACIKLDNGMDGNSKLSLSSLESDCKPSFGGQ